MLPNAVHQTTDAQESSCKRSTLERVSATPFFAQHPFLSIVNDSCLPSEITSQAPGARE
jgi:hypothetical protein